MKFIKGLTEKRMKKFKKMHDEAELPKKENFKKEMWNAGHAVHGVLFSCWLRLLVLFCFVLLCWWCSWLSLDLHHQ